MLLKKSCRIIGLQFLLTLHAAHSFVLLTANIEDVKRLASKFVSDSLAEKIAEFITKATEQIVTNVSAENEMNAEKYSYASNMEDPPPSEMARQRHEKRGVKKRYSSNLEPHNRKLRMTERIHKSKNRFDKRRISAMKKPDISNEEKRSNGPAHPGREYMYLTFNKPSQIEYYEGNKKVTISPITIKSTFDNAEIFKHNDEQPIRTQYIGNSHRAALRDGDEKNNTADAVNVALRSAESDTSAEIKTNDLEQKTAAVMDKEIFGLSPIATSGPITFPKADMKTYWEKQLEVRLGKKE